MGRHQLEFVLTRTAAIKRIGFDKSRNYECDFSIVTINAESSVLVAPGVGADDVLMSWSRSRFWCRHGQVQLPPVPFLGRGMRVKKMLLVTWESGTGSGLAGTSPRGLLFSS